MVTAVFLAMAVLALVGAGWQTLGTRPRPARAPLTFLMITGAGALAAIAPGSQRWESQLWPSLGRLLSNSASLVVGCGLSLLVLAINAPARLTRRTATVRVLVLVAALVVMTVSFLLSHVPNGLGLFTGLYRGQPSLVVYIVTYSLYLGVAAADVGWGSVRIVPQARGWARAGLVLMTFGSGVALAYLGEKIFSVLREVLIGQPAEPYCSSPVGGIQCTFSITFPVVALVAIICGMTVPAFAGIGHRRAYRALSSLWSALADALPEIELSAGNPRADLRFRLYRRVIEIRDGLLILAPGMPGDGVRRDARAEATAIAEALRQHQENQQRSKRTGDKPADPTDLAGEIRWLCQVSREFAQLSP